MGGFHLFGMSRRGRQSRATWRQKCCFARLAKAGRKVGLPTALSTSLMRPQETNLGIQLASFPQSISKRKKSYSPSFCIAK